MTEVPKIVYDRLRAALPERAAPEQAHPDADLLTAFAERQLSATERDGVLEHLALCGDCRELIALALPAAEIVAAPIATGTEAVRATGSGAPAPHKLSFSWPSLRWAALAAGVAVVASVLLLRPGKLNQAMPPSVARQVATTVPPASGPQIASSSTDQSAVLAKTDEARPKSELRLPKKLKAGQVVTPSLPAESGILLADNKKDSGQTDKLSAAPPAGAPAFDALARRGATETVEVSGAAAEVAQAPSAEGTLMARNEMPAIEKAKPARQGMEVNEEQKTKAAVSPGPTGSQARDGMYAAKLASPASQALARNVAHNVTWAITAGVLRRSLDGGQSWQNALRADHSLLCYASHGEDVWTGGQAGTLFYSANSGLTWVQVQPSIKAQQLSSDVTHIDMRDDVRGPAEIVLSTSNNEIWSSADGGKTWEKK
jgi:Putative zinc-finger